LLLPQAVKCWDAVSIALEGNLPSLFGAKETSATVELKLRVELGRNGPAIRNDLTTRIEARQPRVSDEIDIETSNWFRRTVESIQQLDCLFKSQLMLGSGER
jgi:hypothetical protein